MAALLTAADLRRARRPRRALLDELAATYLMLFIALTELGIARNAMLGNGSPRSWATLLPGYGPA